MGSINFAVVPGEEPLAVACLLEADTGAAAGVLATGAIVLVHFGSSSGS